MEADVSKTKIGVGINNNFGIIRVVQKTIPTTEERDPQEFQEVIDNKIEERSFVAVETNKNRKKIELRHFFKKVVS